MATYRILSLDGGGIRGVIEASLLGRLELWNPGFLSTIDLIAGTSTGGILAIGLAAGMTPAELADLYVEHGAEIFADAQVNVTQPRYSNAHLLRLLRQHIGDRTLGSLRHRVLISSFDLDNQDRFAGIAPPGSRRTWKAKFFHNYPNPDSDSHELAVDVALRTSAAPTYFPIVDGFIDGGVVANNPSMCALAQALDPNRGAGRSLADVRILSLGTGQNQTFIETDDTDWGLAQWMPHLVGMLMDGSMDLANYQCTQILGDHYHRLNPLLDDSYSLDAVHQIPPLNLLASECEIDATLEWLKAHWFV
jgi:patatin-like phospholipase/acyl hydrolase